MTIRVLAVLEARYVTGAVKPVLEFAREASQPGASPHIEISFLTFLRGEKSNSFTRALETQGLPLDPVWERRAFDFSVLGQLREIVERRKPDIIWTHSVKSHFLIRLAGLHRRAKWVAFHHGYTATALRTHVYNQLDRWSHRGAARLVTVCEHFARQIEARGISPRRLRVQHTPIRPAQPDPDFSRVDFRRQAGLADQSLVLLTVGRLSAEKDQALFLQAAALLRQLDPNFPFQLLILGDGPERGALQTLAVSLNIEPLIIFAGQQDNTAPYYAAADIFVLSSRTEGSPNVLLEAMDAGLAIVATAVGGVPEVVRHEESALLIPAADPVALAQAILRLSREPELRARLVAAGKKLVDQNSPQQYFQRVAGMFTEVMLEERPAS